MGRLWSAKIGSNSLDPTGVAVGAAAAGALVRCKVPSILAQSCYILSSIDSLVFLAGGSGRKGADLTFTRHVPKFLQAHAHLLGGGVAPEHEVLDDDTRGAAGGARGTDNEDEDDIVQQDKVQYDQTPIVVVKLNLLGHHPCLPHVIA